MKIKAFPSYPFKLSTEFNFLLSITEPMAVYDSPSISYFSHGTAIKNPLPDSCLKLNGISFAIFLLFLRFINNGLEISNLQRVPSAVIAVPFSFINKI